MGRTRALGALRALVRVPRTVRFRLTLFYGAAVLISGGVLLTIAFAIGSNRPVDSFFVACRGTVPSRSEVCIHGTGTPPPRLLSPGRSTGSGRSSSPVTGTPHRAAGGGTLSTGQAVRDGAQIASSGTVRNLLTWSIVGLAVATVLTLVLGWLMSGRMLRPLRTITNTTQHISEENLHERLALNGPRGDELKELGDTIDGLLGRLEVAFDAQGRFVQNASHELRTPIAMMRTSLDVATGKPRGVPAEVTALATKVREGLDQAERLLESFLVLARVQGPPATDQAAVALAGRVDDALRTRQEVIDRLELRLQRELGEATAFGSRTLLSQAVANLVDNAVRHNEPGGWLRVETTTDGATARLIVENGGAVLDQGRVDLLGEPFQRLATDRTGSDRGFGLGLSIVAAIVKSEGGTLDLSARSDGGLRATVELPAAPLLTPSVRP